MLLAFQWTILFFYKGLNYPATGLRQFCVEIAPPFDWRNIDAALLREHSVRRIWRIIMFANFAYFCLLSRRMRRIYAKNSKKKLAYEPKKIIKKPKNFSYIGRIRTRDLLSP